MGSEVTKRNIWEGMHSLVHIVSSSFVLDPGLGPSCCVVALSLEAYGLSSICTTIVVGTSLDESSGSGAFAERSGGGSFRKEQKRDTTYSKSSISQCMEALACYVDGVDHK